MMGNMNNSMNGSMNRMGGTSKDALLMAVNQAGFAVTEANLIWIHIPATLRRLLI